MNRSGEIIKKFEFGQGGKKWQKGGERGDQRRWSRKSGENVKASLVPNMPERRKAGKKYIKKHN